MADGSSPERDTGRAGFRVQSAAVDRLAEDDCWRQLRGHALGRLAIVVNGVPRVYPMNYATGDGAIVFRTEPGTKLSQGPGTMACFELDGYDPREAIGWSVMATGLLHDITADPEPRSERLRGLAVMPAAPGTRAHWLSLEVSEVSGRSFRRGWLGPGLPGA